MYCFVWLAIAVLLDSGNSLGGLNESINACDTSEMFVPTFPIQLKIDTSVSYSSCSFAFQTDGKKVALLITSLHQPEGFTYAYLRSEDMGYKCHNKTVQSFLGMTKTCVVLISEHDVQLTFKNADVQLEIVPLADDIQRCASVDKLSSILSTKLNRSGSNIPTQCNVTEYDSVIHYEQFKYGITCPIVCTCTLGDQIWTEECLNGTWSSLIVYDNDINALLFSETGLNRVDDNAFRHGLFNIKYLYLNGNRLQVLPLDIFSSLWDLQYLLLDNNGLHNLQDGLFTSNHILHYLDLSINELLYLPQGIFNPLFSLWYLDISYNHLIALPNDVFGPLQNLASLFLNHNQLTILPNNIFHPLHSIRHIYLNMNNITLSPGMFFPLQKIELIDLSSNMLTILRASTLDIVQQDVYWDSWREIWTFYMLYDLSSNRIRFINEDTFTNVNVTRLLLTDNLLTELPRGVFQHIYSLEWIDLSQNHLQTLPEGVFDYQFDMGYLDLSYNMLEWLPQGIFDIMFQLVSLQLNNNLLSKLQGNVFLSLVNLEILVLGQNRLSSLPSGVFDSLIWLQKLDLLDNNLVGLPFNAFESCFALDFLRLNDNALSSLLEDTFNSTTYLRTLLLNNNALTSLRPDIFRSLIQLQNLDLSYNNLKELPYMSLSSLRILEYLSLTKNDLTSTPSFGSSRYLTILDLSQNQLTFFSSGTFKGLVSLKYLSVAYNSLSKLPIDVFSELSSLMFLNLGDNELIEINHYVFINQSELITLNLAGNLLSKIVKETFYGVNNAIRLDLDRNKLVFLDEHAFDGLDHAKFLNLSGNNLQKLNKGIFNFSTHLSTIDLKANDLYLVDKNSFAGVTQVTILVDKYATCCFIEEHSLVNCVSETHRPVYLTCKRMLPNVLLRISMWCLGILAVSFNSLAFFFRYNDKKSVQGFLIYHLSLSDFLMGVNMILLASSDAFFGEFFPSYSNRWRQGIPCKIAGMLSILSCEASVFFITLISLDRFSGVKYPFSSRRLTSRSAKICVITLWSISLSLGVIPVALSTVYSDVFDVSEVCIGVPIVKRPVATSAFDSVQIETNEFRIDYDYGSYYVEYLNGVNITSENVVTNIYFPILTITSYQVATYFSIAVFIGVNLVCFIIIGFCYVQILYSVRTTAKKANRNPKLEEELRLTIKSFALVFTDFCCWVPLLTVCILVQFGAFEVSPDIYAWTVALILPINSSINPFMYTLATAISDRMQKRRQNHVQEGAVKPLNTRYATNSGVGHSDHNVPSQTEHSAL